MTETILLTGGAGYVGSHTNKHLSLNGYRTVVLDNLEYGHKEFVKWGEFVQGDVGDAPLLRQLFCDYQFSAVLHFAAYASVGESVIHPGKYWRNNVSNTLTLLEQCAENGVNNFVFSSTCATYGNPDQLPILEDHRQNPVNPYGAGKLAIELMLKDFSAVYGMRYFILRYFNAAGADPDGDLGEKRIPETHLIPILMNACLRRNEEVSIYGVDYSTNDGTCIRDYIHVMDLADAHYRALHYLLAGNESQECNLGLGTGFSVKEVVASVERVTGCQLKVRQAPKRRGDPPALIANVDAAKRILEWTPIYTDLDAIIETAWDWHKKINIKNGC